MDQSKIQAVVNWPVPTSHKDIQHSLGFANFDSQFTRNFSTIVAPLHCHTPRCSFLKVLSSRGGFLASKKVFCFSSSPEPPLTFTTVYRRGGALDSGLGAVLSQRSGKDNKIYPCEYLSRKLSLTERNCSIGDRELLAVKTALEGWRHWLEGAEQPFIIWS